MRFPVRSFGSIFCLALLACAGQSVSPTTATTPHQEFQFQELDLKTARQYGRTLNMVIRYRYREGLSSSQYPDYRIIRREALDFLRIRASEPANEYWEVLNGDLARHLFKSFPLQGITSQMQVKPTPNSELDEPDWHSSIVTIGAVTPIDCHR